MGINTVADRWKPVCVMGANITPFGSYEQAGDYVLDRIRRKVKTFCVAINPEKIYRARRDVHLSKVLKNADMGICDGVGAAIAIRLLRGRKIPRCTGVDLFYHLIKRASQEGVRVFLLGASADVNEKTRKILSGKYPSLRIVGTQDGYFSDKQSVVNAINASKAQMVFVAMGSPTQEFWIEDNRDKITAPFVMGVGGTFDVVSGKTRRAPLIFRATGTEYLYRLIVKPSRFKRQIALPLFALSVIKEAFFVKVIR